MIPCTCPQYMYPPLFKSLSYATSLLGKTYISTCFRQWKEIRRGFPLLRKKAKSLQLQFCKWVEPIYQGFPDSSVGKESACNAGDPGSIPGSERSAGEGISYPLQHSWGFPWWLSWLKESDCTAEDLVWSLNWEDPLEKGKATHSRILAWTL